MKFFNNTRTQERDTAKESLKELVTNQRKINIIHYSCESFYQVNGNTPRITAICIKNTDSNSCAVFSIHLQAQIKNKPLCCLTPQDLDLLERNMLNDFYKYIRAHKTNRWVHWNMRDSVYGFDAIATRYKILGGNPVNIESQFRYNLSNIIYQLFTSDYEDNQTKGRLLNLATRNGINLKDALTGEDEANAFNQRDYQKLSLSTSRKVEAISQILDLVISQNIKVKTPFHKIYGLSISGISEMVKNNWVLSLLYSILIFVLGIALEGTVKLLLGIN